MLDADTANYERCSVVYDEYKNLVVFIDVLSHYSLFSLNYSLFSLN